MALTLVLKDFVKRMILCPKIRPVFYASKIFIPYLA